MKKFLFVFITFILNSAFVSQNSVLKGKVIDFNDGEPLIGATVRINHKNIGTTTNYDGYFELKNLNTGNFILTVSYIGYSEKKINIIVNEAVELLPEINLLSKSLFFL